MKNLYTRAEMSEIIGMDETTLSRWIKGGALHEACVVTLTVKSGEKRDKIRIKLDQMLEHHTDLFPSKFLQEQGF